MVFQIKSRKIEEITRGGDQGKSFIFFFFVPLFTLSLLRKIVCSLWFVAVVLLILEDLFVINIHLIKNLENHRTCQHISVNI